eukprot:scaffold5657_cov270-Pinguiococcus_pyrenoidosus.AAC.7
MLATAGSRAIPGGSTPAEKGKPTAAEAFPLISCLACGRLGACAGGRSCWRSAVADGGMAGGGGPLLPAYSRAGGVGRDPIGCAAACATSLD